MAESDRRERAESAARRAKRAERPWRGHTDKPAKRACRSREAATRSGGYNRLGITERWQGMPELLKKIAIGSFVLIVVWGCGGAPPGPDEVVRGETAPAHPREVVVTGNGGALPGGCRPRPVAELLIFFFDAFNRGSRDELSRAFFISEAPSPSGFSPVGYDSWSWYSSSEIGTEGRVTRHFTTSDQGELLRYFATRHERGERLRLLRVSLTLSGLLDEESNVGFAFVAVRDAPDLAPAVGGPARVAYGKGALNCENLRIFAWRMDMKVGEQRTQREAAHGLCANPPRRSPGRAVIACA